MSSGIHNYLQGINRKINKRGADHQCGQPLFLLALESIETPSRH